MPAEADLPRLRVARAFEVFEPGWPGDRRAIRGSKTFDRNKAGKTKKVVQISCMSIKDSAVHPRCADSACESYQRVEALLNV